MKKRSILYPFVTYNLEGGSTRVVVRIHDSQLVPLIEDVEDDPESGMKWDDVKDKFFYPYRDKTHVFLAYPKYSQERRLLIGYTIYLDALNSTQ